MQNYKKIVDFGDLIDNIGGIIVALATVWGLVVTPTINYIREQRKKKALARQGRGAAHTGGARPSRAASAPRRQAPAPRAVAADHAAEEASFKPWPVSPAPAPAPLAVEPSVSPFISGEEGLRVTADLDTAALPAIDTPPSAASEILGSRPDDTRKGVIWAEILRPKFMD